MIVTVTPNPALDLTWHVERIIAGGTHRADAGAARAGGKGLNVARVASAAGARVIAVATVGGPTGEEFEAELQASGVPAVLVPVAAPTRRSIALVDEALGDTTIINERGTAPSDAEWAALRDAVAEALTSSEQGGARDEERVLVISGSVPPGTPHDVIPSLIALGREAGAIVIADTSGPALLAAADAGADVLKPNVAELAEATGIHDPIDGARELLRHGASLILLSRGADGMLAISESAGDHGRSAADAASPAPTRGAEAVSSVASDVDIVAARLPEALAGNPTGAGDAAVAAAAVLLTDGTRRPDAILRRATSWSAAAVLMPLAGDIHPSWPDLEAAVTITREKHLPARETRSAPVSQTATHFSPEAKDHP